MEEIGIVKPRNASAAQNRGPQDCGSLSSNASTSVPPAIYARRVAPNPVMRLGFDLAHVRVTPSLVENRTLWAKEGTSSACQRKT